MRLLQTLERNQIILWITKSFINRKLCCDAMKEQNLSTKRAAITLLLGAERRWSASSLVWALTCWTIARAALIANTESHSITWFQISGRKRNAKIARIVLIIRYIFISQFKRGAIYTLKRLGLIFRIIFGPKNRKSSFRLFLV